jgi:ABC-type amino acid transport system permease subunit
MKDENDSYGFFVREIPFLVLLVFWIIYGGIEIIRGRFDLLTSVIPTGLFIVAYLVVRWLTKEGND